MASPKVFIVLALAGLFLVPPANAAPGGGETASSPRTYWNQPGAAEVELKQNGSVYTSTAFSVPVPANSTVSEMSVDIQGKMVKGPLVSKSCDYNDDSSGHKAYTGVAMDWKRDRPVRDLMATEFTSDEYSSVMAMDDTYVANMGDFAGYDEGYQLFRFSVPVDESSTVRIFWKGHAQTWSGSASPYTFYIWNNSTHVWDVVETATVSNDVQMDQIKVGDYFVDNRTVYVMAMCTDGNYILTDYVNITVQGYPYFFPKNPAIDIGPDGKADWSMAEPRFDYTITLSESSFVSQLERFAAGSKSQTANITVKFISDTPGKIRISNFNISFSAPPWCRGIPDTFHIDENTPASRLIDLNKYFVDDRDVLLNYTVSWQQDSKKVQAFMDSDGHSLNFKTITRNWYGAVKFRVKATDLEGLSTESNNFTLTVDHVNQPPAIPQITDQRATQGIPYTMKVSARDPDTDLDPNETLTYSSNATFFVIDPRTGWINFTPRQQDVGVFYVCVTAADLSGLSGSQNFTFTVEDTEDPPVLQPIPDLRATEGEPFFYLVVAVDPDVPYGDALNFSDDCPLFTIDRDTGEISFSPAVKDIGTYRGNISVRDLRGESDRRMFNLSVLNYMGTLDRPPAVETIPALTAVEGEPFMYQVNASDPDPDDSLEYKSNLKVCPVGAANGTISFMPRSSDVGVYNIKITVSDWEGLEAVAAFKLTILKYNHPPTIVSIKPRSGKKVLPNTDIVLSADATDADNDRLSYTWKDGDKVLGAGSMIVAVYQKTGTYNITLIVSDGKDDTVNTTVIKVVSRLDEKKSPGFGALVAAGSAFLALLAVAARRRKRV